MIGGHSRVAACPDPTSKSLQGIIVRTTTEGIVCTNDRMGHARLPRKTCGSLIKCGKPRYPSVTGARVSARATMPMTACHDTAKATSRVQSERRPSRRCSRLFKLGEAQVLLLAEIHSKPETRGHLPLDHGLPAHVNPRLDVLEFTAGQRRDASQATPSLAGGKLGYDRNQFSVIS